MFAGGFMPVGIELIAPALVVVCSAYQFSQTDAKTEDHFFKGFPSYWPVLAFYMLLLDLNPWVNFWVVVLFCVLVFVPIKYIYPSRTPVQPVLMMGWSILWGIVNLTMLWFYPDYPQWMMVFSLSYVVYYYALSFYLQYGPKSSKA
jgi:phosphatidylcholine synthase